ncbi:extracellular solute-binding protein [Salinibacterium sp. NG22]|uniref:ABC transporter substrate-binding protein n=1 Tax=Salinibacterium sp. NG22 TaxID=2792040 RepID=UPI0018CF4C74|nr:extracellular solute-binding protein [Salinibacterium sp. NG22]MBH0110132.1 extracellular solute-binding protein [Salinibacterium sp. NG22]
MSTQKGTTDMAPQHFGPQRSRRFLTAVATLAALGLLASCSSESAEFNDEYGFAAAEQVADSTITIWADAARQSAVEAFIEAHPEIDVDLVIDDGSAGASGTLKTKISLADQAGEGWPDAVFSSQTNDASWAAQETNGNQAFAAPLNNGYLEQDFLDGFTAGALDPVTVDGTVYGLRNDLAPVLFWYNESLFNELGYDVPTTWEDYEALGAQLADENPGYFLGSIGDSFVGPYVYYWAGQAPIFQLDGDTFNSDLQDPNSQRVTAMLDTMHDNGSLISDSLFSAEFVEQSDKLLATPGAAWYAGALIQNPSNINAAAGDWAAAAPLVWEGEEAVTGNIGGGVWYASSHSENLDAVETFMEFITSDAAVAGTGGLPAYDAAAQSWLADQESSGFFGGDFTGAMNAAATSVWSGWSYPDFSIETSYAKIIVPGLAEGKSIAELSDAWQQEMQNEAQVVGYQVQ